MHDNLRPSRGADADVLTGIQAAPPATAPPAQRGNAEPGANACAAVPRAGEPDRGPLSHARRELSDANRELHAASAALQRCRQPVDRLRSLMADCDAAERQLETYRQRNLAELGKWLAGDSSPASRPPESQELLSAEQSLARIARDAAAARRALPDHEAVLSEAARAVGEATARRNAAHRACILASVAEHIERNLVPALKHAQQLERSAWQIHDLLDQRADHVGAAEIRNAMHRVKTRQYERPASAAEGRAFSDRLLVDPSAELVSEP